MSVESTELEENLQAEFSQSEEETARERHRQRIEEMRRSKEKQMEQRRMIKKYAPIGAGALAVVILLLVGIKLLWVSPGKDKEEQKDRIVETDQNAGQDAEAEGQETSGQGTVMNGNQLSEAAMSAQAQEGDRAPQSYHAQTTEDTLEIGDMLQSGDVFYSQYAILIDRKDGDILAEKNANVRINPASMTKILTVLVAAEQIQDLDDTFTMTRDITDYCYVNDCSYAGFEKEETVSIRDLFYGAILPSGADAAVALAVYVSGSQEAFVELMNEKLAELGLAETTHFTNCVGIFGEDHYSTVYDMAMIMEAAMDNELCRTVMSAHTYTTSETTQHPEGIILSNWFLRRIEDRDSVSEVVCGKTGYVTQSGSCAASYAVNENGKEFICVTANANSGNRCIADQARLYKQFS